MTRIACQTAIVIGVLAAAYALWQLAGVAVTFVLSLALAAALRPPVDALVRRKIPRSVALVAVYLAVVAAMGAILFSAGTWAFEDLRRLGQDAAEAHRKATTEWLQGGGWRRSLAASLPRQEQLETLLGLDAASLLRSILGATLGLFGLLANGLVIIILSLYWSFDRVHFERLWLSLLPVERRVEAREVWRALEHEVGAYLRSETVQALSAGAALTAGYALLGQPYPVLAGTLAAVAWLLPWVGVLIVTAGLVLLATPSMVLLGLGPTLLGLLPAVLFTLLVLLVLEHAVEPRLFDRRRYNPLPIAIITIGLADVLGLPGLLLGPPLAVSAQSVGRYLVRRRLTRAAAEPVEVSELRQRLFELEQRLANHPAQTRNVAPLLERLKRLLEDPALNADGSRPVGARSPG